MRFVISSNELLSRLQAISRVINSKNTLPVLDCFLFNISGNKVSITASDLESTLDTSVELENIEGEGLIAIPAKRLTDTLKEFQEQPLTFDINPSNLSITIISENGKYQINGMNGDDFPQLPVIKEETKKTFKLNRSVLATGIAKTIFATADDELRPIMNGIFFEIEEDSIKFVASDAHKLVKYQRAIIADSQSSFVLPTKPASLIRNVLGKDDYDITIEFDDKNVLFTMPEYTLICRLLEGVFPNYNAVIPVDSPSSLTIDRVELYNTLRRVSVFTNQASNLVKLQISANQLVVSAQDIDFSISGYERLNCSYDGVDMEIGFKSLFLLEILSNLSSPEVIIKLADPSRAGIVVPSEKEVEDEDVLMLLMPMMIKAD